MGGAVGHRRHRLVFLVGISAALAALSLLLVLASSGEAAYPGTNGKIAFVAEGHQIISANADGSDRTVLNSPPAHTQNFQPAYSADGSRIAFVQYADSGENGLWVMNADGSDAVRLRANSYSETVETTYETEYPTPEEPSTKIPVVKVEEVTRSWNEDIHPSFSPDGSQLAVEQTSGTEDPTFVCAVETSGDEDCIPSGSSGYYQSYEAGECEECQYHIATVSATTGAPTGEVTTPSSSWADEDPSFSSTGAITFERETYSSETYSIYVVPSGGGAPVQVTDGPSDYEPSFSPDGSKIVFATESEELGVVSSSGGSVTAIPVTAPTAGLEVYAGNPTFSPDGEQIAFELYVYGGSREEEGIYTVTKAGTGQKEVIPEATEPTWQPIPIPAPPATATPISSPAPSAVAATSHPIKGKVKLSKSGVGTIGTVVCGSSACKLKVLATSFKVGKKKCAAKVTAPGSLAAGKTGKVTVAVKGKCLASLGAAGKGKLSTNLSVSDSAGTKTLAFNATLTPPKATKSKHKK